MCAPIDELNWLFSDSRFKITIFIAIVGIIIALLSFNSLLEILIQCIQLQVLQLQFNQIQFNYNLMILL